MGATTKNCWSSRTGGEMKGSWMRHFRAAKCVSWCETGGRGSCSVCGQRYRSTVHQVTSSARRESFCPGCSLTIMLCSARNTSTHSLIWCTQPYESGKPWCCQPIEQMRKQRVRMSRWLIRSECSQETDSSLEARQPGPFSRGCSLLTHSLFVARASSQENQARPASLPYKRLKNFKSFK